MRHGNGANIHTKIKITWTYAQSERANEFFGYDPINDGPHSICTIHFKMHFMFYILNTYIYILFIVDIYTG